MRKIVAQLFVSVDGVMEAPEEWHFPYYNEQMGEAFAKLLAQADTMLLGRATYEIFADSWPHRGSDVPFADQLNTMPKLVASTTLAEVRWQNSTLIRGNVADELTKRKQQAGKNMAISGSPTLVRSLLRDGVLDELQLLVHPVVLGSGRRLFEDEKAATPLQLADSITFSTGVVSLTYQPA
ncbi:dihydrofolate reductase family protein [Micromonospora sp. NPDC047548]|uniref:dihydrofolate reductase family protein n=1 Tax=Micromonospora sp. NPDC047548 TaxID=3155624 RepID=UPI003404F7EF